MAVNKDSTELVLLLVHTMVSVLFFVVVQENFMKITSYTQVKSYHLW